MGYMDVAHQFDGKHRRMEARQNIIALIEASTGNSVNCGIHSARRRTSS